MRVSHLRGAPTRPNGHKDLQPRERAVDATTAPERLDEEIESLLLSLDEPAVASKREAPARKREARASVDRPRRTSRRRTVRPQQRGYPVNAFDIFFVVTAIALGFAVGLLTVLLVNG